MRLRTLLSTGLVAALTASLLAVSAVPTPAPVQATASPGWSALGSGTQGTDNRVFQMAKANDGTLYVGGTFTSAGGVTGTRNIARWNPTTSAWTPLGGGITNSGAFGVFAVAYDPTDDEVWIGGTFSHVSGSAQSRLAMWDVSNAAWPVVPGVQDANSGVNWDGVEEITVVSPNQVYVGGYFEFTDGTAANGLAMYNGTALKIVGGGLGEATAGNRIVNGMTRAGNGVIVGGQFTRVSGSAVTANFAAQWDGTAWSNFGGGAGWGPATKIVAAVASTSAGVVIGGNFAKVQNNGTDVADTNLLAMWNGTAWTSIGTVEGTVVEELQVIGNYLYAGGVFSSIGGVEANNIARYDLTTQSWEALTDLCLNGVNGVVRTIVDAGNGAVYVGGAFTDAGGVPEADGIALYRPGSGGCPSDSSSLPGLNGLPAPDNFRVEGVTPDRVGRRNGMQVHLAWDVPSGTSYRQFNVTTRGRFEAGTFTETADHTGLSCWTSSSSCTIFFPFTSNDRTMAGRQYHQLIYTLQGYSSEGSSQPISIGPLASLEPTRPSAPLNVTAEAGYNTITVTWDAPTSSGSAGFVMNYLVRSSRGNVCITRVTTIPETADARRCTFTKLRPGTDYTFTVEALSTFGWGATSEASNELTPYFLRTVDSRRQGPWFSLAFGSRTTWIGEAPGYRAGTQITPYVRIGTGTWQRDDRARVRVGEDGRFTYRRDVNVLYSRRTVSVRFAVGDPANCTGQTQPCGESVVATVGSVGR